MTVRYATEFGLSGDGTANETTAMQSAPSALLPGEALSHLASIALGG